MEAWTIHKFEKPYIDLIGINLDPESAELLVETSVGEYVIEREGGTDQETVRCLQSLRSPDSSLWASINGDQTWADLLQQMDHLGLVRDAAKVERDDEKWQVELSHLYTAIDSAATWVLRSVASGDAAALRRAVALVLSQVDCLVREADRNQPTGDMAVKADKMSPVSILELDDFYIQAALLQCRYQLRSAPMSLFAGYLMLQRVAEQLDVPAPTDGRQLAQRLLGEVAGGLYRERDVRVHLDCLAVFLSRAGRSGAERFCTANFRASERRSGIDFMIDVERVVTQVTAKLETPRYLAAVNRAGASPILAQGCYLQEYHVTCRFVEILTPMMAKRLAAPLRARMFKYYSEEVGHEAFEYDSCRSLGLSHEHIVNSEPLPLHSAYIDVFTYLAEVEPIGYFTSLFITEGLLGDTPPLDAPLRRITGQNEDFEKGAGRHAALNDEYNHTSLSRLFMRDIASVSPAAQQSAIQYMLFLLELNYRAWDDLLDHYSGPKPFEFDSPSGGG